MHKSRKYSPGSYFYHFFTRNQMKQIKLKDLYQACKEQMEKGNGEKSLILSDDNEGNGYHGMFYTLTVITPENVDGFSGLIGDNAEPDIHNIIVVG